jgi:hypothetical protein
MRSPGVRYTGAPAAATGRTPHVDSHATSSRHVSVAGLGEGDEQGAAAADSSSMRSCADAVDMAGERRPPCRRWP